MFTASDDLSYLHGDMALMPLFFAVFLPVMSLVYTGSSLMQAMDRTAGGMPNSLARNMMMGGAFLVATITVGTVTSLWWAMALSEILGCLMMRAHVRVVLRKAEAERSAQARGRSDITSDATDGLFPLKAMP